MEERVYICGWEASQKTFRVWLKEKPFSKAEATTAEAALESLIEAIQNDGGAVTPVFEFSPPLPRSEQELQFLNPELLTVTGDARFETEQPSAGMFASREVRELSDNWAAQFFTGEFCRTCTIPGGGRNEKPLKLTYVRSSYDGGFVCLGLAIQQIYSEDFLALLTGTELAKLQFRPVVRAGRASKRYFELIGPTGIPFVGAAGVELGGWRCPKCGQSVFNYFVKGLSCRHFVAHADLPTPLPELFTTGPAWSLNLCVTGDRWKRMVGQKGTRGLVSSPLGVLSNHMVVREPELKPLELPNR